MANSPAPSFWQKLVSGLSPSAFLNSAGNTLKNLPGQLLETGVGVGGAILSEGAAAPEIAPPGESLSNIPMNVTGPESPSAVSEPGAPSGPASAVGYTGGMPGPSTPSLTSGVQLPATPGLSNWLVGFGGLAVVLLLLSEGKHTSELGAALGVTIAGGLILRDGGQVVAEVNKLFGTTIGGSTSA